MKSRLFLLAASALSFWSSNIYAQGEEGAPPDQGFWQTIIMIAIFFLFFYLILWRPEQKKRKALEEQRNSLKKGDRVVAMGIIGSVVRVNDSTQTVILKMHDGTKLEFLKGAITDIIPETEESNKKIEKISEDT